MIPCPLRLAQILMNRSSCRLAQSIPLATTKLPRIFRHLQYRPHYTCGLRLLPKVQRMELQLPNIRRERAA
ncbi:hypothetical protein SS1G_09333 [Sclerotinia sclerotiorum 1980 UF-70]|uniref:Uncharacterized protein n=1 Tax=Sclerotinia sclerotiorum (strain ATCC 18683 / 1980 / Ss-1) TaxID=665079 RepID=A7EVH5_SCLS1|nr:hypothetical protein SS1G_09333 [Sclerotinia sclerotiorum 1980 UF-70]EDN93467.1 hypothetical protein SS1G_09333 [Sclerotinia sclerotiorum 1980 UF-70]